jgi:hypothetical protein
MSNPNMNLLAIFSAVPTPSLRNSWTEIIQEITVTLDNELSQAERDVGMTLIHPILEERLTNHLLSSMIPATVSGFLIF